MFLDPPGRFALFPQPNTPAERWYFAIRPHDNDNRDLARAFWSPFGSDAADGY
jgi:hypothetical protein